MIALFCLAVVAIAGMLYGLAVLIEGFEQFDTETAEISMALRWWQPHLLLGAAIATCVVVGGGSLYKIAQLRGGGAVVAEALGGVPIAPDSQDPHERRLLNVVEEMAIASGTPTPRVYLLERERGINAFAAGFAPSDAVIGVTRGCVERLSRDELQGVIAHEFSHILSGDMGLNIRLMGVLHGILVIGMIGYYLLRSSGYAPSGGRGGNRGGAAAFVAAIVAIGFGLMLVGFVGTFFGNLIKAAVSRQREYFADASAVQFTRNPEGIAGALKRIAGVEGGSILHNPAAPEASHSYFSQGLHAGLQMIFATHPPLLARIRRLDPSWNGEAPAEPALGSALAHTGQPTADHVRYASALVANLPAEAVEAAREPFRARALIYALLIHRDGEARDRQLAQLELGGEAGIERELGRLLPAAQRLEPRERLPLVDLALPALGALSHEQYRAFDANLRALVAADERIELFEFVLQRVVRAHLQPRFERATPPRVRHASLRALHEPCSVVLSSLAYAGSLLDDWVRAAFDRGAAQIPDVRVALLPRERAELRELDRALQQLAEAAPGAREPLLHACAACIATDREVSQGEGELLRAIADSLGCPMPPLLPGQTLC